jgi:hypothetical protein
MAGNPKNKQQYEVEPWTCSKCQQRVFIPEKIHAYVCKQYIAQAFKEKADGKAGR